MSGQPLLGYVDRPSPLHHLGGAAKLILVTSIVIGAMIGFDPRFLGALAVLSLTLWVISRVRLRDMAAVLIMITVLMLLNNVLIFLFAPDYGQELFGTRHVLIDGPWHWDLTSEQLYYQGIVTLKYLAMLPPALLFVATTQPSEFASSLSRLRAPDRLSYGISLALRYIPEVQREVRTVAQAQQARGMDMSRHAGIKARMRAISSMLMPLLFRSLERIETVSSTMELRGFGRSRRRTWYRARPFGLADWAVIGLSAVIIAVPCVLLHVNGGRFWNVFAG